jgi:hypothetical protein
MDYPPMNSWSTILKIATKTGAQKEGARWGREEGVGMGAGQPSSVTTHMISPVHLSVFNTLGPIQ